MPLGAAGTGAGLAAAAEDGAIEVGVVGAVEGDNDGGTGPKPEIVELPHVMVQLLGPVGVVVQGPLLAAGGGVGRNGVTTTVVVEGAVVVAGIDAFVPLATVTGVPTFTGATTVTGVPTLTGAPVVTDTPGPAYPGAGATAVGLGLDA